MLLKDLLPDVCEKFANLEITSITSNSKEVREGCAFICISGAKFDGHNFAKEAANKKAAVIIAEKSVDVYNAVIVEDTHAAYAVMSANWFGNPASKMKLIGVTGTNGKTSVTYMIKQILEKCGYKVGLIGTIQNMIGDQIIHTERTTPNCYELNELFDKMNKNGCDYAVMEVSSHALDQKRVYGLNFQVGVFTNLTQDHLDYHITMDNYLDAKKKLFSMCNTAVVNGDDPYSSRLCDGLGCNIVKISAENKDADYFAEDINYRPDGVKYKLCGEENCSISLATGGRFSVYNSMCAAVSAIKCGLPKEKIEVALKELSGVKGRAEAIKNNLGFTVIIDYAHTPDGLENILNTFKEFEKNRLTVLFGCGGDRDKSKRPIMGEVAARLADNIIVTSDNPRSEEPMDIIKDIIKGIEPYGTTYTLIENRIEAIGFAIETAKKGDIIVLAGKGHEDYQVLKDKTIHLDEREIVEQAISKREGKI